MTNKKNKTPLLWAMAIGAGLFLLLQIVVSRVLERAQKQETSSSSSAMIPAPRPATELFRDDFFSSPFMIDSGLMELKKEMEAHMQELDREFMATSRLGGGAGRPSLWDGYDIQEDSEKVTVTVSVPKGVLQEDIHVEIINGSVMHISGQRKKSENGGTSEISFDKRFALGRNMDQSKITANLKDGTLTITTPKVGVENKVREIPIIKTEL